MPAPTIRIEDPSDPRIDPYRNVRDADLIRDRASFIAEGRYVLQSMLRGARYPVRSVLLNEPAHARLADTLAALPDTTPVYICDQPIMDEIVGFHIHRGCLAEGDRTTALTADRVLDLAGTKPLLILEDLTNHDNVGGLFRAALALGAGGILLTARSADPLYRKAIRVSMGAALQLPWATTPTIGDAITACAERGRAILAMTPDESATDLRALWDHPTLEPRPPVAVLLGTEGEGLTRKALDLATLNVRIDIDPRADSLNVTTAGTVALYELTRMRE